MNQPSRCDRCQGELIRRSRPLLLIVGLGLCLLPLLAIRIAWLWIPAVQVDSPLIHARA